MTNEEYAIAYSEVLEILKYVPAEDYNKIPKEKIRLFKSNAIKDYNFKYNIELTLDEQNVSKRGKAIIAILFRDYWATDEQRNKIKAKQAQDRIKIENDKKEKYNPNDIFGNREKVESVKKEALVEYKEGFFVRIINKIKSILNIK